MGRGATYSDIISSELVGAYIQVVVKVATAGVVVVVVVVVVAAAATHQMRERRRLTRATTRDVTRNQFSSVGTPPIASVVIVAAVAVAVAAFTPQAGRELSTDNEAHRDDCRQFQSATGLKTAS